MSDLDNEVKPFGSLLMTARQVQLTAGNLQALGRWLAMKACVLEHGYTAVITNQTDRDKIRDGSIGNEWQFWIGCQDEIKTRRGFVRHVYAKEHTLLKPLGHTVRNKILYDTQLLVWRLGYLVVLGYFSRIIPIKFKDGTRPDFIQVVPAPLSIHWPPVRFADRGTIRSLETSAAAFFGL